MAIIVHFDKSIHYAYNVFDQLFKSLRIKAIYEEDTNNHIDIYYGNNKDIRAKVCIPNNEDLSILKKYQFETLFKKEEIEYDLIYICYMLISDRVNSHKGTLDAHGRKKLEEIYQFKNKITKIPVVGYLRLHIKNVILRKFNIELEDFWGEGVEGVILLTHDVDNPEGYKGIKSLINGLSLTNSFKYNLMILLRYFNNLFGGNYFQFKKIIDLEKSFKFKSSFYFSVRPYHNTKNWRDVPYNAEEKKYIQIMKKIIHNKFEIGLHSSLISHRNYSILCEEKLKLEKLANIKINGLRHHYWKLPNPDVNLKSHEKCGFYYDTSISFQNEIGFRRSSGIAYQPLTKDGEKINVYQLPNIIMDAYAMEINEKQFIKEFSEILMHIKNVNGIGVIDWHVRTTIANRKFKNWAKRYKLILEMLSEENTMLVTSPKSIIKNLEKSNEFGFTK